MKILIVDALLENRQQLEAMMRSEQYEYASASNGIQALKQLRADSFDAIISDIQMPRMDGFRLIRECKKDPVLRRIPFVFYTATYTGKKDEQFGLSLGAIRYIIKPAEPEILLRSLKEALSEPARSSGEKRTPQLPDDKTFVLEYASRISAKLDKKDHALKDSENRYRAIIQVTVDGFWMVNPEGKITDVNETYCRMTGYTRTEMLNMRIGDIDANERPAETAERMHRIISNGSDLFETRHRRKDGSIFDVEMSVTYMDMDGGQFICFCRDITERKRVEEDLRASEVRFRALIQNSSDIIRILDRQGRITYESPSAERILGFPHGFLIGKDAMNFIHPDDVNRVKKDFGEVISRTNPGTPVEFRIRKADGEYLWVDSIGSNMLHFPGVNGIVITTRPIQQKKETEQALLENQKRLTTAMDIARLVNWEFDVASGMFTFDDNFYSLYESIADREGGNLMSAETYTREFVYPDDRSAVLASIQKILATTDPTYTGQIEHRITPRDGSVRYIIARFVPVMGPEGTVIRTLGVNQDITDLKIMESEIRSLNTVLEQRVRDRTEALSKANVALKEENAQRLEAETKLQSAYNEKVVLLKEVHHRVKNNLQIISSLFNLQSRYIKDETILSAIRESQNRVKAMALVHEKLYRSEDLSHISLYDYVKFLGTGLFQSYDAKTRGIRFVPEIHDVDVNIDAAIPIGLIINELISNSLKYAFPDGMRGEIFISVNKEGNTLTILYRDTGVGIPADLDWKNVPSLGLRLINTLVEQMDGTVELDRTAGTQFTLVVHEKE
jgi:PAS domain S-box-containing protein